MDKKKTMTNFFEDVETTKEHNVKVGFSINKPPFLPTITQILCEVQGVKKGLIEVFPSSTLHKKQLSIRRIRLHLV